MPLESSPREALHFLEMICPGDASKEGCAVCPLEMAPSAQNWQLRTITFGQFLAPKSEDALVAGVGCEDHANLTIRGLPFHKGALVAEGLVRRRPEYRRLPEAGRLRWPRVSRV
jgi:hypothetical protein